MVVNVLHLIHIAGLNIFSKGANNALAFSSGFAIRTQPIAAKLKKVYKKLEKDLVVSI
jgi:hypothetical protein